MKPDIIPLGAPLRNQRGATLFAAILALLLLSTMTVAFTLVARDEAFIGQNTREAVQAEFSAEGGASHGRWLLAQRLRVDLPREVANTLRATMINDLQNRYNTEAGAAQFLMEKAIPQGIGPTFSLCSSSGGCPEPVYSPVGEIPDAQQVVMVVNSANPEYTGRVIVGVPPGAPPVITNGGTGAVFNYMWRVDSTGTSGRSTQLISHDSVIATLPGGTFTISLNSNFVQFAHFIDQMDDTQAWISFRHVYTGPVHTNTRFNILGNPTGPTFRAEATQTLNTTRFNNGGSATTVAKDSTANDWPLLGPQPGVLCKSVDCTGFTRNYDFDPSTPAVDPIPFPAGPNPADRTAQINLAKGLNYVAGLPVWVANDGGVAAAGNLNGGIYVIGGVVDLRLDATATGQHIVIQTGANNRTDILENRPLNQTIVTRQCRKGAAPNNLPASPCVNAGPTWNVDVNLVPATAQVQTLTGKFTPDFGTPPPNNVDFGIIFVEAAIGQAGASLNGLRQTPGQSFAIYQDPLNPNAGSRLTVAANGNIFITGHLRYQTDSRGLDGVYGDPVGSGDDQLPVQNVLGVVSWGGGIRLASGLSQATLAANYPAVPGTDLLLQGMFMAPNIANAAEPNGQISFDDPNGAYRGLAKLLGGVVQKTMGTFGSPGSPGTGYARDWVYDERFRQRGLAPPLFPGFPKFTASTSLGIDDYTWRMGRF